MALLITVVSLGFAGWHGLSLWSNYRRMAHAAAVSVAAAVASQPSRTPDSLKALLEQFCKANPEVWSVQVHDTSEQSVAVAAVSGAGKRGLVAYAAIPGVPDGLAMVQLVLSSTPFYRELGTTFLAGGACLALMLLLIYYYSRTLRQQAYQPVAQLTGYVRDLLEGRSPAEPPSLVPDSSDLTASMQDLRSQWQQRLAALETVAKVAEDLTAEVDPDELMARIVRRTLEAVGCQRGALLLIDPATGHLMVREASGISRALLERTDLRFATDLAEWVVERDRPLLIQDGVIVGGEGPDRPSVVGDLRQALLVPLRSKAQVIGVLFLEDRGLDRVLTPAHQKIASTLAGQAAVALYNAKLYQQARDQIRQLTSLNEVGQALGKTLSVGKTLHIVSHRAVQSTELDGAVIVLAEGGSQTLQFHSALGSLAGWTPAQGNALTAFIQSQTPTLFGARRPVLCPDLAREEHAAAATLREEIGALFLFPLTAGQQHGALAAAGRRRHELSPQQVDFLTTLANQAAMVLDNARLYEEVRESYFSTITALARSIDARDEYTHGHSERVTRYALMSARQLGFTEEQLEELHVGAILHDVGKIGIPDDILNKPGRLSEEEFEIMKQHPTIGAKILEEAFSRRPNVIRLVKHHHERYDGRGYPDGLRGEEVPMSVLVLAVADSYDAMTSDRCYRRAFSQEAALHELRMGKLKHYHPDAVEALVAALEEEAGVLPFQRPSQREPVLVRRDRPAVAA